MTDDTERSEVLAALAEHQIVAIVREPDPAHAIDRAHRLLESGLRIIEVSMTTPGALDVVERLAAECAHRPDVVLGVGTVLTPESARQAAATGARFVIAPTLSAKVIHAAHEYGLAAIPGCATPTEMYVATELGADAVKIFPATTWSPAALASVLQALPFLRCIPTGGVNLADVPAWLAAGALAVGLGSALSGDGTIPAPQRGV